MARLLQEMRSLESGPQIVVGGPSNKVSMTDLQELYIHTPY
jgi:hypothetical protein